MASGTDDARAQRERVRRARHFADEARSADLKGDTDRALSLFDLAIRELKGGLPLPLLADVLRWKGTAHRERGETQLAQELYERSLGVAEAIGETVAKAHALNCLGIVAQRRGDVRAADDYYATAQLAAEQAGEAQLVGM